MLCLLFVEVVMIRVHQVIGFSKYFLWKQNKPGNKCSHCLKHLFVYHTRLLAKEKQQHNV